MSIEIKDTEKNYIEEIGLFFEKRGLPRMAGRMLGWLLIADPPYQSPTDIAEVLMASKGSVSSTIRLLTQTGMIERYIIPGERHDHFRLREDTLQGMVNHGPEDEWRMLRQLAERGLELMQNEPTLRRQFLEQMRDHFVFLEKEFPALIERYEKQKAEKAASQRIMEK
jgi:DNA-binding transcriptional regulator GbsR (MarR family)